MQRVLARPLDTLNQRSRQAKLAAQCGFLTRHCTIIALMVETRQMENSMQCQNLDFVGGGMSEPRGILHGDVPRDGDLSGKLCTVPVFRARGKRKRQNVCGFVLAEKLSIQRTNGCAGGDEHIHAAAQPGRFPRSQHETGKRCSVQSGNSSLQNDQVFCPKQTRGPAWVLPVGPISILSLRRNAAFRR